MDAAPSGGAGAPQEPGPAAPGGAGPLNRGSTGPGASGGTGAAEHGEAAPVEHPDTGHGATRADANGAGDPLTEVPGPHHGGLAGLTLGALGIVFGDIGTSPLYSLQTVFSAHHNDVRPTPGDVYGVISMVFWSVTLIVSLKYVALVMRADNEGEGGILALVHLLRGRLAGRRMATLVLTCGIVGAALFYGDSVITPAISVMSAIEGLEVVGPGLRELVLPISVVILTALFLIQRWGTSLVGKAFGPVMVLWFATVAALGVPHVVRHPSILFALSPHYALAFVIDRPFIAFVALGAVVLTITGAEALYADMGHFGARPIRLAWFCFVFPALTINYLGQGAMILDDPATVANPFFRMAPSWATLPLVVLATLATVIASQAVISGAYSVSRQATRLGLLPRLKVLHTSRQEGGQIYVPAINWILYVGVLLLISVFRSSSRLASAYGLAVTGTLLLTSVLFLILAREVWRIRTWKWWVYVVLVVGPELVYFGANVVKFVSGGWLPVSIAAVIVVLMTTWRRGRTLVVRRRVWLEGPLDDFLAELHERRLPRVPGLAVFPHPDRATAPLALRGNVDFNHVLHEHVVIISIVNENVPHVRHVERISVNDLGAEGDGIVYISCRVGFNDSQDVPKALALAISTQDELAMLREQDARYFVSVAKPTPPPGVRVGWRARLYLWLANNAADSAQTLRLPPSRTVMMGVQVKLAEHEAAGEVSPELLDSDR